MDASQLEELLATTLRKALQKGTSVTIGPASLGKFSGVQPEVFIHLSEFQDFDGCMPDGTSIARYPAKAPPGYRGYTENRPVQLTLSVSVVENSYPQIKKIANIMVPTILLTLESVEEFSLCQLENGSVKFDLKDLQRSLYRYKVNRVSAEDISVLHADYEFKINGFLSVWMTKRGGLIAAAKIAKPSTKTHPLSGKKAITGKAKSKEMRVRSANKKK